MNSVFHNPWVTGIICSLIATIIAAVFGYPISKKRNNNVNRIKRQSANNEVISAVKQYVVEESINIAVIESLITCTAKKYELAPEKLIAIPDICDALIGDILRDPYVSKEMRSQYTAKLIATKEKYNSERKQAKITEFYASVSDYNSQIQSYDLIGFLSRFLDRFAPYYIFFYILFFIKDYLNGKGITGLPQGSIERKVLVAAFSALISVRVLAWILRFLQKLVRKNRKNRNKEYVNISFTTNKSDTHSESENNVTESGGE